MHCRFSRIRREANNVAHQMVKAGALRSLKCFQMKGKEISRVWLNGVSIPGAVTEQDITLGAKLKLELLHNSESINSKEAVF
ncbi:hypothetical protein Gohar_008607 [Gossypium harknessii]|uniref:Uncharacterized protein n=1 Tax=Gossypium harknessii TaxID=34285 RepID=A0A7J9GLH9_9ROSI|nr:hypothetical protein [Gossypium harknessii]